MSVCDKPFNRFPVPAADAQNPHCTELVVRRSRFLTYSCHCPTVAAARAFVAGMRLKNADATHNCWAFVAGSPGNTASIGSSDDGEPHGTAGRPMLNALLHSGTGEVCSVVSRWFGGVKLGTGGLARAYQDSVLGNLESLPRAMSVSRVLCKIVLDYAYMDGIRRLLLSHEGEIRQESYSECAELLVSLPDDRVTDFCAAAAGVSNGSAAICAADCI